MIYSFTSQVAVVGNPKPEAAERGQNINKFQEARYGLLVKGLGSILPAGLGGSLAGFDVTWALY